MCLAVTKFSVESMMFLITANPLCLAATGGRSSSDISLTYARTAKLVKLRLQWHNKWACPLCVVWCVANTMLFKSMYVDNNRDDFVFVKSLYLKATGLHKFVENKFSVGWYDIFSNTIMSFRILTSPEHFSLEKYISTITVKQLQELVIFFRRSLNFATKIHHSGFSMCWYGFFRNLYLFALNIVNFQQRHVFVSLHVKLYCCTCNLCHYLWIFWLVENSWPPVQCYSMCYLRAHPHRSSRLSYLLSWMTRVSFGDQSDAVPLDVPLSLRTFTSVVMPAWSKYIN